MFNTSRGARLSYSLFFTGLALVLASWAASLSVYALFWPAINAMLMALAYGLGRPGLVLGKSSSGKFRSILLVVNLPWLVLSWSVLWIQSLVSSESPVNRVGNTNVFIGRMPLPWESTDRFDLIVDLTAEFPRWYRCQGEYLCLPNLDAVALSDTSPTPEIQSLNTVLIHCAQGHGRSATFASLMLGKGAYPSALTALEAIQEARPGARPSGAQFYQLEKESRA